MQHIKHPAGPFTVSVRAYRISPAVDTSRMDGVYTSRHRSAKAAARRLASIISGRSALSVDVKRCIPRDHAGSFSIVCGDGTRLALNPFRERFGK